MFELLFSMAEIFAVWATGHAIVFMWNAKEM